MAQLIFPEDLQDNSPFVMFTPYDWTFERKQILRPESIRETKEFVIIMHPPNSGIIDSVSHSWDETEGMMDVTATVTNKAAKMMQDQIGAMTNKLKGDTFFNDFVTLIFNGSSFREFTMSWEGLVPKSFNEAQTLDKIIKYFSSTSSADYRDQAFIKFPSIWTVNVYTPGREIIKWENVAITRYSTNYQPNGVLNHFRTGHPIEVSFELSFKQLIKPQREDYIV